MWWLCLVGPTHHFLGPTFPIWYATTQLHTYVQKEITHLHDLVALRSGLHLVGWTLKKCIVFWGLCIASTRLLGVGDFLHFALQSSSASATHSARALFCRLSCVLCFNKPFKSE